MSQLVELIKKWELFIAEQPGCSTLAFALWLLAENTAKSAVRKSSPDSDEPSLHGDDPEFDKYAGNQKTSMQGAYLIGKMNQYVSYYTKPMMKKHGLHSLDDFGYLQNIRYFANITKTKACELMLQEITTGVDIIKRLIKNGFIEENVNEGDKREKLLQLSLKGDAVLNVMYMEFLKLPDTLGTLSNTDRETLLQWLQQLDVFHENVVKGLPKK